MVGNISKTVYTHSNSIDNETKKREIVSKRTGKLSKTVDENSKERGIKTVLRFIVAMMRDNSAKKEGKDSKHIDEISKKKDEIWIKDHVKTVQNTIKVQI